jgi:DNA-binding NarL/FixJ family response regulator
MVYRFTERQRQIMDLIADGCDTQQVCQRLFISDQTLKNHLTHIYRKLEVKNRTKAAMKWHRLQRLGLTVTTVWTNRERSERIRLHLAQSITLREAEILELICTGMANKEIAAALGLSESWVKNMIYSILYKMQVPSRTAAAVLWVTWLREDRGYTDPVNVIVRPPEGEAMEDLTSEAG